MNLSLIVARLRWKIYKLSMLCSLGRLCGKGMDQNMIYSLAAEQSDPEVATHLVRMRQLSPAHIEQFDYPADYPNVFIRGKAVSERYLYELKDVALSPNTGAMWIPEKRVLVESLGSIVHFFAWGGLIDVMRRPKECRDEYAIVSCSNMNYFHWLLDAMGQVLLVDKETKGHVKVAASPCAHHYIRDGLKFFGFDENRQIKTEQPIRVHKTFLAARNSDLGIVPHENIEVLQAAIQKKVRVPACRTRRIYISRRLEKNRAIVNEAEVEALVKRHGFEVCYFEKMPFAEQMQTIADADIVMGAHGAGLSNIIAGQDGLKVFELLNPNWFNLCFAQLAHQLGFGYHYCMMNQDEKEISAPLDEIEKTLGQIFSDRVVSV